MPSHTKRCPAIKKRAESLSFKCSQKLEIESVRAEKVNDVLIQSILGQEAFHPKGNKSGSLRRLISQKRWTTNIFKIIPSTVLPSKRPYHSLQMYSHASNYKVFQPFFPSSWLAFFFILRSKLNAGNIVTKIELRNVNYIFPHGKYIFVVFHAHNFRTKREPSWKNQ